MDRARRHVGLRHGAATLVLAAALLSTACHDDYRIGEFVWVGWEGRDYPAYVIDHKIKTRYRVHYDGYDSRWDEDVTLDRIRGRIHGPVTPPPPPEKVARAMGLRPTPSGSAGAPSSYSVGDRIRVRWRGSAYAASIVAIDGPGKILVRYDGYGNEWDEVVTDERIVGKR